MTLTRLLIQAGIIGLGIAAYLGIRDGYEAKPLDPVSPAGQAQDSTNVKRAAYVPREVVKDLTGDGIADRVVADDRGMVYFMQGTGKGMYGQPLRIFNTHKSSSLGILNARAKDGELELVLTDFIDTIYTTRYVPQVTMLTDKSQ